MELKHLIAAALIFLATGAAIAVACLVQRARDWMFFLLVAGAVVSERIDVNFFSEAWYRGTTRGVEISLIDLFAVAVLVSSLLVPGYRGARWYWPAGLAFMAAYFGYACFSVAISEPKIFGVFELSKLIRGGLFFLATAWFVRTKRELQSLVLGLVCAVGLETLLGFKQRIFGGMDRVAGSLDHANSLSMYLCLVGPVLAAAATADFPRWVRRAAMGGVGAAATTMMLTLSRAGVPMFGLVIGGTLACCVPWRLTAKRAAIGAAIALGAVLLVAASWRPLMARYGEATLAEEYLDADAGNEGRGVYFRWAGLIVADHFFGLGLNNWSYGVSKTYGAQEGFIYGDYDQIDWMEKRRAAADVNFAAPAHNLGALTLGELGLPGLVLFTLVWLRWFQTGASFLWQRVRDPMHRLGVGIFFGTCGIFLQSLTEWVYRQTPIFVTFHLLAGTLAALYYCRKIGRKAAAPVRVRQASVAPAAVAVEAWSA